jgi:hypothetical protein
MSEQWKLQILSFDATLSDFMSSQPIFLRSNSIIKSGYFLAFKVPPVQEVSSAEVWIQVGSPTNAHVKLSQLSLC